MLIGIAAAIILLTTVMNGSESVLLSPNAGKFIKKHVEAKETQKEILSLVKDYKKDVKPNLKREKKLQKEMEELRRPQSPVQTRAAKKGGAA